MDSELDKSKDRLDDFAISGGEEDEQRREYFGMHFRRDIIFHKTF